MKGEVHQQYIAIASGEVCSNFADMDGHFTSGPLNNDLLWLSGSHRGFEGIVQCGNRRLDRALISALVERWRPETHTFHLPIGETTITLQDVNILWGLPIEGDVVSGVESNLNNSQITALFENLVGEELSQEAVNDSASNWVHINYLSHLEDLNNCGQLSWGSAVLACLYKHLCKVTDISRTDISGPVFLLQLWAWERFSGFAPEAVNTVDFQKPYGARPYENVLHLLPGICMSGQASWRSETYLIFWEIVEPHLPSRVMRQFRMFQPIPVNTLFGEQEHRRLHKISRTGGRDVNWLQKHNQYVLSWVGRHNNIVTTEFTDSCVASPEYMQWYLPRTILYTVDPRHHQQNQHGFPNDGGTLQMTWDIMSQIYQRTGEDFIRDMASQAMGYGHVQHHMGYYPTHLSQDPVGYQVPFLTTQEFK
ncbi:hypothetical protein E3N88_33987 [Mikania micrantha]|uniref:Aminotransferase-like plant mobile domain-containing protein n=1 Tax=Mikania micrantha TaxID=192012 RepID=A0A5N6MDI1_9ASTR|nr:hypothetical protein E3N88_33987 [Mikania micrantha]